MGNYSSDWHGGLWPERDFNYEGLQGAEGASCWLSSPSQSLLFRVTPPAWPLRHSVQGALCLSVLFRAVSPACACSPAGLPSFPLSVRCLTVLSELEWCPAWWKGTFCEALVLPTKLYKCKSVQDLDQCFCSQHSDLRPAKVWLIAWLLMQGRCGKMGTFIAILKELLLPPASNRNIPFYSATFHSYRKRILASLDFFSTVT